MGLLDDLMENVDGLEEILFEDGDFDRRYEIMEYLDSVGLRYVPLFGVFDVLVGYRIIRGK